MKNDKSSFAIGGGVITGLGIGLFFLNYSALFFIGSILTGLGIGLIIASLISNK